MAHHQGMSFLALAHVLLDRPMQRRFASDPAFRATDLLLQERVPRAGAIYPHPAEVSAAIAGGGDAEPNVRVLRTPSTPTPQVQLLSNGSFHVMVTNAGGGQSRWGELALTRWREDPTRDCWGSFCYLRDVASGGFWSVAHQPTLVRAARYEAIFSQGRAEFRRSDGDLDTHVEISVSPEDNVELRRVSLTNRGSSARTIELTSYAEVVLATQAADAAHPAFSNLFVQTEWYTGSAAWMYRLAIESLRGVHLEIDHLRLDPLVPAGWRSFDVHYRHRQAVYHIHVRGPAAGGRGVSRVVCDGVEQPERTIPLGDDAGEHHAEVWIGQA